MRTKNLPTFLIFFVLLSMIALTGCGNVLPDRLIGDWRCDERSTGVYVDTSFYSLHIDAKGNFSLHDNSTNEAALSGTMKGDDTGKLGILELKCDKPFNPPECWSNLHENSRLRYKIIDENTIRLGYVGIWMTFRK